MVCSFATTSTRTPSWAAVAAVTGPIQATLVRFTASHSAPSKETRCLTVDELVKVVISISPCKQHLFSAARVCFG